MNILKKILGMHDHEWVEVDSGNLVRGHNRQYTGKYWTYQCSICKKLKEVRSDRE